MHLLLTFYRISNWFSVRKLRKLSRIIDGFNYFFFNSYIPGSAKIGRGTILAYGGIGIVIHNRAVVGENCIIGQGITIGGRSKIHEVPVIGDEVYLGAGCRIIGPISIGDNVIIGPNSVVVNDVEEGSVVVGVPGRVIRSNIVMRDNI
jgi:serine O-acetyltransferase